MAALTGLMWWMMTQPMYQPGDVRAGRNLSATLVPPAQGAADAWQMQLVVHGSNDLQPAASSRLYAEAFPNAQFRVIQGASHFPQIDRPDEFAKVVGAFLQAHGL